MKLNILCGTNDILSGHVNIDPWAKDGDTEKIKGNIDNLDYLCEDGECTSIIATDVISYFPAIEVANVLENWVRKLRHKGSIIIGGADINELSKAFFQKQLDLVTVNILLFGEQKEPWQYKKNILNHYDLTNALEKLGLKIIKKRLSNYCYLLEANRP